MSTPSDDKFTLSGGDAEFGSRTKNIFAGLESLEARHVAVESSESAIRESYALMKPDPTEDFFSSAPGPGDSANFQVPSRPPPKRLHGPSRPGYETNPSKWKRYDLSDVSASQMSEHSNQQAAREFLNRFKVRSDDAAQITDSATDAKHVFRKPDKKPEPKEATKQLISIKDEDDVDETEDATRTQILSFADDAPLSDGRQAPGGKVEFRHRRVKQMGDRKVRSHQTTGSDDDEDDNVTHTRKPDDEVGDNKELRSTADISRRTSGSDSDSDNFDDLEQVGSDGEQEEEGPISQHDDNSATDIEKYAPEDVDLESID